MHIQLLSDETYEEVPGHNKTSKYSNLKPCFAFDNTKGFNFLNELFNKIQVIKSSFKSYLNLFTESFYRI